MATRNMADGLGHSENGQTKGERYAQESDACVGERAGKHSAATAPKYEPESAKSFCAKFLNHFFLQLWLKQGSSNRQRQTLCQAYDYVYDRA